jgi:hypothetical protein
MIAHQRLVRDRIAADSTRVGLFGTWWDDVDVDIARSEVRQIDTRTAASIILDYEWLGSMPPVVLSCYGIYFDGALGGAVVFAPEYTENLGVWDKYGYTNKIILLARGACTHWAHPHAASRLIGQSIRLLPKKYEVVTATVDERAGEIGTIYQACNFTYVGKMRSENPLSKTKTPVRSTYVDVHGQAISSRHARRVPAIKDATEPSKARYFFFRGRHRVALARGITALVQPFPKRVPSS